MKRCQTCNGILLENETHEKDICIEVLKKRLEERDEEIEQLRDMAAQLCPEFMLYT